ncbi:proteasome maturation protein [Lycorma delicatula]|uniref:proteasome maturation protein n=1 Tax=Lycorma delicatula TaxID=130591 RepID=UPI003F511BEB
MSFQIPPLKVKADGPSCTKTREGIYGIPDPMTYGIAAATPKHVFHPLEASERNYAKNQEKIQMTVLRNIQGLHAPLRIAMELKAFNNVGHLPFLPSSGISRDVLLGNDDRIEFSDFLNMPEFQERRAQPHACMEHKLGIL